MVPNINRDLSALKGIFILKHSKCIKAPPKFLRDAFLGSFFYVKT